MLYQYVPDPVKWAEVKAEVLINTYGQPHEQRYSHDDAPVSDMLQDLLDMHDPDFMLEHTRQHRDGVLLVDKEHIGYFESLMTQVMRAEDLYSEINRLYDELGGDPEVDAIWEAHIDRVTVIEETSARMQERPADMLQVLNMARLKCQKALTRYLDNSN